MSTTSQNDQSFGYLCASAKTAARRVRLQANRLPLADTKAERMAIQAEILSLMDVLEKAAGEADVA
jgi:hypothetical protein